jgi:hypothetical protein
MTTKNTTQRTPELSFDGCGINGPDEYRTRLATFNREGWPAETVTKYGKLLEAAPELLAAVRECCELLEFLRLDYIHKGTGAEIEYSEDGALQKARAAIARATGDSQTEGGRL